MESKTATLVDVAIESGAAWLTINRPGKLNALNRKTVEEIAAAAVASIANPDVKVLILTGAGDKAFAAGADIGEMASLSPQEGQEYGQFLQNSLDVLERSPKPVIACVNGFALGGGCELAMACHVRIASETARFGQPEVNLGLIPGAGGTQRLQRLVGRGIALELILSGAMITSAEAHRIGLVNRVVPATELKAKTMAWAGEFSTKSPVAMSRAIQSIIAGGDLPQDDAMRLEAALFGLSFATSDMKEGTTAFLEKRKPVFPGK
jgi:enoyl-CoA hydratase